MEAADLIQVLGVLEGMIFEYRRAAVCEGVYLVNEHLDHRLAKRSKRLACCF